MDEKTRNSNILHTDNITLAQADTMSDWHSVSCCVARGTFRGAAKLRTCRKIKEFGKGKSIFRGGF